MQICTEMVSESPRVLTMSVFSGVGAMTWSPLACGIISGKYDGRVPPYSRASLKVDKRRWMCFCVVPARIISGVTVLPLPLSCLLIVCVVSFRFCNSLMSLCSQCHALCISPEQCCSSPLACTIHEINTQHV